MVSNSRQESRIEQELRRRLFRRGLRYRKHPRVLAESRCRPDIVFLGPRIAVFVDGCFWHSCPQHATEPKRNEAWWAAKLAANVERDRTYEAALIAAGWSVMRFWEHEDLTSMADQIEAAVRGA
jgi:DNA mismatch endonuclease (patch repair protein)